MLNESVKVLEKEPEVKLLGVLSSNLDVSPEDIILSGLMGTTSHPSSFEHLRKLIRKKKDYDLIKKSILRKHISVTEKAKFEISYKNLPYIASIQMSLMPYFDILQQSFRQTSPRYVFVPCAIKNTRFYSEVRAHLNIILNNYHNFVNNGVDPKDARYMLPMSFEHNLSLGGNIREFKHFSLMLQSDDKPDILRKIDNLAVSQLKKYFPNLMYFMNTSQIDVSDFYPSPNIFAARSDVFENIMSDEKYCSLINNKEKIIITDAKLPPGIYDISALRHGKITHVSKMSIYLMHRLARHRTWDICPEPFRQAASHYEFVTPPKMQSKLKKKYVDTMNASYRLYERLKKYIPEKELICILPYGTSVYALITMNFWNLQHQIPSKLNENVHWEMRSWALDYYSKVNKFVKQTLTTKD